MATPTWPLIDFHVHIRPPWWQASSPLGTGADADWQRAWTRKLTDPQALLSESQESDVTLRLLSSTVEGISGIIGPVDQAEIRRHNDYLADLVERHPDRLAALATVDAFSGEIAAREAERAVTERGHVGIVIDSARDGRFAGHPDTRPVFEAAARLKVPVLVHPLAAVDAEALIAAAGRAGNTLGRGHLNGVAFLSILESGLLATFPDLDVVFTGIGLGALTVAATQHPAYDAAARASGRPRPNLYFDFMGLDPAVLRFAVEVLGVERVLLGTDWPIHDTPSRSALETVFEAAGIVEADRAQLAGGNARRLLARRSERTTALR